jgi:hypothetical protein
MSNESKEEKKEEFKDCQKAFDMGARFDNG